MPTIPIGFRKPALYVRSRRREQTFPCRAERFSGRQKKSAFATDPAVDRLPRPGCVSRPTIFNRLSQPTWTPRFGCSTPTFPCRPFQSAFATPVAPIARPIPPGFHADHFNRLSQPLTNVGATLAAMQFSCRPFQSAFATSIPAPALFRCASFSCRPFQSAFATDRRGLCRSSGFESPLRALQGKPMSQPPRPKGIPRKQTQHVNQQIISKRERCPAFLRHASARNTAAALREQDRRSLG